MLFDWLMVRQVVAVNPASAVRGPKHGVKRGKTPVLDPAEGRRVERKAKAIEGRA
jgi:site-specific recombinase XerC